MSVVPKTGNKGHSETDRGERVRKGRASKSHGASTSAPCTRRTKWFTKRLLSCSVALLLLNSAGVHHTFAESPDTSFPAAGARPSIQMATKSLALRPEPEPLSIPVGSSWVDENEEARVWRPEGERGDDVAACTVVCVKVCFFRRRYGDRRCPVPAVPAWQGWRWAPGQWHPARRHGGWQHAENQAAAALGGREEATVLSCLSRRGDRAQ
mmetsp:Transcript_51784/g.159567  ORF Transcript_51784/g.159567 Transcript_51784/m.159567 type:complete len:210 (+) Transcript_51784:718-1347(+)